MRDRTYAAYVARSKVSKALVDRHPQIDVVMQLGANWDTYWGPKPADIQFAVYTDYMNLLSKGLPDFGFPLDERRTYPRWNELERRTLIAQDHVFVMGNHVKPAIAAAYGISDEKIVVVGTGPGLDLDIERDGYPKDYRAQNILFVGKEAGKKGLAVLLRAFARVSSAYPDAVLHVVTGKAVTGRNVVFHGNLDYEQLKELFYRANVFAMPAYKEPLGLVFVEAMWSRVACIGTTVGSMPELIRDGETGYLVEPGDEVGLADRISAMLGDPERTRQMSEHGYAAAKSYWRWDRVVEQMLAALGERRCTNERD